MKDYFPPVPRGSVIGLALMTLPLIASLLPLSYTAAKLVSASLPALPSRPPPCLPPTWNAPECTAYFWRGTSPGRAVAEEGGALGSLSSCEVGSPSGI
ncbi:hypothetical protein B0H17DRAFT_1097804, partial [Mycena rosella]